MTTERGSKPDRAETGTGSVHESPGADRHSPEHGRTIPKHIPPAEALLADEQNRLFALGAETAARMVERQYPEAAAMIRTLKTVRDLTSRNTPSPVPASGDAEGLDPVAQSVVERFTPCIVHGWPTCVVSLEQMHCILAALASRPTDDGERAPAVVGSCTCMEAFGEDLACPAHGTGTPWADENPDIGETA